MRAVYAKTCTEMFLPVLLVRAKTSQNNPDTLQSVIKQTVVHPHHGGLQQSEEANYCTVKETINKMKRPPTKWVKIFVNHIPDKGLISKIYKEFIQLSRKKQTI